MFDIPNFEFLVVMVLLHFLYDIHLQGEFVMKMKNKSKFMLFVHSLTYSLLLSVVTWKYMGTVGITLIAFVLFLVTHYVVDGWKERVVGDKNRADYIPALMLDQAYHVVIVVILINVQIVI